MWMLGLCLVLRIRISQRTSRFWMPIEYRRTHVRMSHTIWTNTWRLWRLTIALGHPWMTYATTTETMLNRKIWTSICWITQRWLVWGAYAVTSWHVRTGIWKRLLRRWRVRLAVRTIMWYWKTCGKWPGLLTSGIGERRVRCHMVNWKEFINKPSRVLKNT